MLVRRRHPDRRESRALKEDTHVRQTPISHGRPDRLDGGPRARSDDDRAGSFPSRSNRARNTVHRISGARGQPARGGSFVEHYACNQEDEPQYGYDRGD